MQQLKKDQSTTIPIVIGMKKLDEKRLDDLFTQVYCKSELNSLKFSEFLMFILDKGFLNMKYNLEYYFQLYNQIHDEDEKITNIEESIGKKAGRGSMVQKVEERQSPRFTKTKFLKFIDNLGKILFKNNKKSLDMILNEIFQDKSIKNIHLNYNGEILRVCTIDDLNRKFMSDKPIEIILSYTECLQGLFVSYQPENFGRTQFMLLWQEVKTMNLRLPTYQFIQLLHDAQLLFTVISFDMVSDAIMRVIPAMNNKENIFYQNGEIERICDRIYQNKWKPQLHEGDPKISFFEFQILLGRLSLESGQKDPQFDLKKDLLKPVLFFFEKKLAISNKTQLDSSFKHLQLLNQYFSQTNSQMLNNPSQQLKKQDQQDLDSDAMFQKIREGNYVIVSAPHPKMEMSDIISMISTEFPPLPVFNSVDAIVQRNGKKFQKYVQEIKCKEEMKNAPKVNKKPQPKKVSSNKDKEPQREISELFQLNKFSVWQPMDPIRHLDSYEHFKQFQNQLENDTNPLQDLKLLPSLSNIQAAPVLLPEVLYPVGMPTQVHPIIESVVLYFSQQNYYSAFDNLESARQLWCKIISKTDLPDDVMVYFEYVEGQIYEVAGQDAAAMNKFMKVKFYADRLLINNPDRSLPYCGFGSVFYHTQEYEYALRSFLKAKEVRDSIIGTDNIENAIIYNNMGCCLHQMGHFYDAETCYQFAEALFDIYLGSFHCKTMQVKRNMQKLIKDRRSKQSLQQI